MFILPAQFAPRVMSQFYEISLELFHLPPVIMTVRTGASRKSPIVIHGMDLRRWCFVSMGHGWK